MRHWSIMYVVVCFYVLAIVMFSAYEMVNQGKQEFEELRLRYAVDYATEGAFRCTLGIDDIGTDYVDMDNVKINPSVSLETFKTILAMSYDMSLSEENMRHIENSIKAGVLFTRDGYYYLDMEEVDNTPTDAVKGMEYQLRWGVKNPYKIQKGGYWYSVNLNPYVDEEWTSVEIGTGKIEEGKQFNDPVRGVTGLVGKEVQAAISSLVMSDINRVIAKRNAERLDGEGTPSMYVPAGADTKTINNIKRPTLIMILQGVDFAGQKRLDAVSVGGVRTTRKKLVVGFEERGIKYYCYEQQLPISELASAKYFFNSMEEAAKEGYEPHFTYLAKIIDNKNAEIK